MFEVKTARDSRRAGKGGNTYSVNLLQRTCTCEKLKIYKLQCSHVLAVCRFRSLSYSDFVDSSFRTSEYRLTYLQSFKPIPDPTYWFPYTRPRVVANADLARGLGRRSTSIRNKMDERPYLTKKSCNIVDMKDITKRHVLRRGVMSDHLGKEICI